LAHHPKSCACDIFFLLDEKIDMQAPALRLKAVAQVATGVNPSLQYREGEHAASKIYSRMSPKSLV
jgi:hypothetical protein